ncbi:MAG: hypothetical protein GYA20_10240 [Chloroflexi bacterium]|nr:hypothetical protein [Chloroflexota bacterium]
MRKFEVIYVILLIVAVLILALVLANPPAYQVIDDPAAGMNLSPNEQKIYRFLKEHGPSAKSVIKAGADICSERAAESAIYSLTGKRLIYRTNPNERGIGVQATYALKDGNHA